MKLDEPRGGIPPLTSTPEDFATAIAALKKGTGPFAIDTERAQGIRYSGRAYLIQIKREGSGLFLIDPPPLSEMMPELAEVLATDEWILHAADQDLPCLNDEGLQAPKLWDTEIAALLLGDERVSLQAVISHELDIQLAKEHSNSDWSQRPLAPERLSYAALDVDLLLEARESQIKRLKEAGRYEWIMQECAHLLTAPRKQPNPEPWRKIAATLRIRDRRTLAVLRELWWERDAIAQEQDLGPEKVLPGKALGALADSHPTSLESLKRSSALRTRTRRALAERFWDAIDRGRNTDDLPSKTPPTKDGLPDVRNWKHRHPEENTRWELIRPLILNRADTLGIRQDVLLKPLIQRTLAWEGWKSLDDMVSVLYKAGARPWQIEEVAVVLPRSDSEAA
ncbi:HRDC domain-containing protein [Flaviflexus massiliensis]|uniref:HRDC domain-containing protein n=1 Tax=Flaviflexus massiliensis TaxID=1522309 RepID=UPI0006D545F7|nr:HRDC domain-containing protein [Flaviflexus massiliensis]